MPCTYTGTIEGDRALAASEALSEVTDMLCRVLTLIDEHQMLPVEGCEVEIELPKDVEKFWKEHKKLDKARKKKEAADAAKLKSQALKKLTAEERKALGV